MRATAGDLDKIEKWAHAQLLTCAGELGALVLRVVGELREWRTTGGAPSVEMGASILSLRGAARADAAGGRAPHAREA